MSRALRALERLRVVCLASGQYTDAQIDPTADPLSIVVTRSDGQQSSAYLRAHTNGTYTYSAVFLPADANDRRASDEALANLVHSSVEDVTIADNAATGG